MGPSSSGVGSSTSRTSKPSKGRPGGFWRKEEQRAPPPRRRRSVFPGILPPEHVKILIGSVPGRRCLSPLSLEEPYDIYPVSTGCLPRPQVYVEQHLAPAGDLPFQLGI